LFIGTRIAYSKNYFGSLLVYVETLDADQQVNTINSIPFDKMNSNAKLLSIFIKKE